MTWRSLTSSPWMSLRTWTVPLGRVSSADRRAISARAASSVGNWRARGRRAVSSISFMVEPRSASRSPGPGRAARPSGDRCSRCCWGRRTAPGRRSRGRAGTRTEGAASRARTRCGARPARARRTACARSRAPPGRSRTRRASENCSAGRRPGNVSRTPPCARRDNGSTDASRGRRAAARARVLHDEPTCRPRGIRCTPYSTSNSVRVLRPRLVVLDEARRRRPGDDARTAHGWLRPKPCCFMRVAAGRNRSSSNFPANGEKDGNAAADVFVGSSRVVRSRKRTSRPPTASAVTMLAAAGHDLARSRLRRRGPVLRGPRRRFYLAPRHATDRESWGSLGAGEVVTKTWRPPTLPPWARSPSATVLALSTAAAPVRHAQASPPTMRRRRPSSAR